MKAGSTAMTQRPRDRVPSGSTLPLQDLRRPDSKSTHKLLMILFLTALALSTCAGVPTGQTDDKEYYLEVLMEYTRDSVGRGQHQNNALVHNSILVVNYLIKMDFKIVPQPPYSPDLAL